VLYNRLGYPLVLVNTWSWRFTKANSSLLMQNDGNLVLINPKNQIYWVSNTNEFNNNFCIYNNCNGFFSSIPCNDQNKKWVIVNYLDGYSTIMNKATGLFLTDTGSTVLTRANDGTKNQDWYFSGKKITNRASNKKICYR